MKKTSGIGNLGAEELAQFQSIIKNRIAQRDVTETLFDQASKASAEARKTMDGLLVQAPAASVGVSPMIAKTAAVDAFFQKLAEADGLTEAQRRFPELLDIVRK